MIIMKFHIRAFYEFILDKLNSVHTITSLIIHNYRSNN